MAINVPLFPDITETECTVATFTLEVFVVVTLGINITVEF